MGVGNIYFAMVDPGDTFDPNIHNREDEDVFKLVISQNEGEFARAEVEIRNPRQGLLAPARKTRVFISCDVAGTAELMFSGRVVGYPSDISEETVSLEYIAQPEDWETTQAAFLDSLKVSPYWNDLFASEDKRSELAYILAGRSALLHWDRKTGALSLSDIIEGCQSIDLGPEVIFDTVRAEVGDPPIQQINVVIEAQWEQLGYGVVDCMPQIKAAFINTAIPTSQINTLTPEAFEDGWSGVRISSGYSLLESKLSAVADDFELEQTDLRSGLATVSAVDFPRANGDTTGDRECSVPRVWYDGTLQLSASYKQKRREVFTTSLVADIQNFSLRGNESEDLYLRLQAPTALAQGSTLDVGKHSFYWNKTTLTLTDYGREVVEHALMRARARLIKSSRAVEVRFSANVEDLIDVDCDTSLRFEDDRLPGGSIQGKVISYILSWDGDSGQQIADVTIGSCIGTAVDSSGTGSPSEVEIGAVDYITEFGTSPMHSSIFYDFIEPTIEEPVDVELMESDDQYLIDLVTVDNDGETQNTNFIATAHPDVYLKDNPTGITIDLKTMQPEAELFAEMQISTETFTLPKQVNLEAT